MNKNTINDEELGAVSGGVAGWSGSMSIADPI